MKLVEALQWTLDNSHMILYFITVGVALYRYPRYYDTPLKYFPILLMYTFLNEVLGKIIYVFEDVSLVLGPIFYNNWIIYNIYNLIFYLYFYFTFHNYIKNERDRKLIRSGGIVLLVVSVVNAFFQDFTYESQVYAYVIGGIFLIICVLLHAKQQKQIKGQWFDQYNLLSWLGLGILVFYVGYLPIKIMRYYYALEGIYENPGVRLVHITLILAMNVCFILGFIKMRRKSLN